MSVSTAITWMESDECRHERRPRGLLGADDELWKDINFLVAIGELIDVMRDAALEPMKKSRRMHCCWL